MVEETTHETKKENFTINTPMAIIVAGVLVAGAVLFVSRNNLPSGNTNTNDNTGGDQAATLNADQIQKLLKVRGDDYILGNKNAPVTMIEFGDFQCPFCSQFHLNARKEVLSKYVDTGKVRIIWRHFPLNSIHPMAQPASEAAECTGEQGKFWQYHDAIYENQESLAKDFLDDYARMAGIADITKFQSCVDSGKYTQKVADDFNLGLSVQVSGTPTFFINGRSIVGAVPFSNIQSLIEDALVDAN